HLPLGRGEVDQVRASFPLPMWERVHERRRRRRRSRASADEGAGLNERSGASPLPAQFRCAKLRHPPPPGEGQRKRAHSLILRRDFLRRSVRSRTCEARTRGWKRTPRVVVPSLVSFTPPVSLSSLRGAIATKQSSLSSLPFWIASALRASQLRIK